MMWDFSGRDTMGYRSRSRSPHPPQLRVPSPAFPIPITPSHTPSHGYGYPTPISSSYPPLNTGYDPYLSYHEYPSISRAPPSPHPQYPHHIPPPSPMHSQSRYPPNQLPTQVIHVIHHSQHHSKNKKHKKPSHSQSPSNSTPSTSVTIPFPSPITTSTSYHSAPSTSVQQQRVHFSSKPPSIVPEPNIRPRVNSVPERERERDHARQAVLRKPAPEKRGRTQSHSHSQSQTQLGNRPADPLNPNFQYSKCTGRRRALCIGINYRGQANELRGCVNDAKHVREFLISHGCYKTSDILLLTDDSKDPRSLPTRDNLIQAMRWLVRGAKKDDSLFFHYSGHGGQTPDLDGDEVDGWDEVIYPLDFQAKGPIIDDEMHVIMVKTLPAGCRLTAVFDACHSGTVLDLPYIYSSHGRLKGKHVSDRKRMAKATPADVISWSGCRDGETSADTFAGGVAVGAMSYAFITALTNRPQQTYQELLRSVRLILHPRFSQRPQLGSSHHIDTNLQFIF